jgi:lysophospholipase L1-like esterase
MHLKCVLCNSFISCALCFSAVAISQGQSRVDLSGLVVVGDSLSAGVQNFSLLDSQQPNGYASVIARQAGVNLGLPEVQWPGAPNVLQLTGFTPQGPVIQPVTGTLPSPPWDRDKLCQPLMNLSIPGVTLQQALNDRPSFPPTTGVQQWEDLVLAYPTPQVCGGSAMPNMTQIERAIALNPTTVIEYLGNNDALVPALVGQLSMLTPLTTFAASYETLLDKLQPTKATIITATIPDVTKVPYFTPVAALGAKTNLPVWAAAAKLGVGPGDYLRPTAVPIALSILSGQTPGRLPSTCTPSTSSLPVATVPCVLTKSDAITIQLAIDAYNIVIYAESIAHGATVVDIHALVDHIAQKGYTLSNGSTLTTQFLGGLFSLDGVHPTNTGYGIIANEFIRVMDSTLGAYIAPADINAIAGQDPLVALSPLPIPAPPSGSD